VSGQHLTLAYDRLVVRAPGPVKNGVYTVRYAPSLATSWKATPKAVTFTLRKDATCADGTPVTPDVVLKSFQRLLTVKKVNDPLPETLGPGPFSVSANAKAGTFTIRSRTPFRHLLAGLATHTANIVCPAGLEAVAKNPKALETGMYGSGPYTLVSFRRGDRVVFKLRPEWKWGPRGITADDLPDEVIYRYVADPTTMANLLKTGAIDLAPITGVNVQQFINNSAYVHKPALNYFVYRMYFNQFPDKVFTNDERFREAVMTAIDQRVYLQVAHGGRGIVSPSVIAPVGDCFDPATRRLLPKPSLERAASILRSAGYQLRDGALYAADGTRVKIKFLPGPRDRTGSGGEYIASQLEKLGIDVEWANTEVTVYARDLVGGNFDLAFGTSQTPIPDPGIKISHLVGPNLKEGGLNFANTGGGAGGDKVLVRESTLGAATLGAESCRHWSRLQRRLLEKHYFMPLVAPVVDFFARRGVDFAPLAEPQLEPAFFRKQ
jgi:peptide/nickel transport system substrate-binding protein